MNSGTDVSRYLTNSVPTTYSPLGHFAQMGAGGGGFGMEGFGEEQFFVASVLWPAGALSERLVPHYAFLSRVLLQHLRQHLPAILNEVMSLYQATGAI